MELSQRDLFHQVTLCDYIFPKDKIFAYLNLDDCELLIYDKLYAMLEPQVPKPDLVDLPPGRDARASIERIKRRKRDYETEISEAYVNEVNKAYNYFFFHYTQTPLLVIDTTPDRFRAPRGAARRAGRADPARWSAACSTIARWDRRPERRTGDTIARPSSGRRADEEAA